jgi:hypothetical protein
MRRPRIAAQRSVKASLWKCLLLPGSHYRRFILRRNGYRRSPSTLCIVDRPRLGTDPHPESHRLVQPIQRFVAFATKCAGPRNASGARSRADTSG